MPSDLLLWECYPLSERPPTTPGAVFKGPDGKDKEVICTVETTVARDENGNSVDTQKVPIYTAYWKAPEPTQDAKLARWMLGELGTGFASLVAEEHHERLDSALDTIRDVSSSGTGDKALMNRAFDELQRIAQTTSVREPKDAERKAMCSNYIAATDGSSPAREL